MRTLVTARAFWVSGEEAAKTLKDAGWEVVHSPNAGPLTEEELIPLLQDCDAVVASSDIYNAKVFAACPQLKIVSRCGVGTDSVNFDDAKQYNVRVANTPGMMTDAVADYTFALMLAVARKVPQSHNMMQSGGWGEFCGVLVCGRTIGLVGFGAIARGVAERAKGFGMKILAFDPFVTEPPAGVKMVTLDRLLAESDFVSLHFPSTPETRGFFNIEKLKQMKRSAYLINTARGAVINEPDLLNALNNGTIAGAAIDVYCVEPYPADGPLRSAPNLILTPHNAFNAVEAAAAMSLKSAQNVVEIGRELGIK
ncbi:MAG: phosphoglycerate dehydrogenase [Chthonomonadales bacterium]